MHVVRMFGCLLVGYALFRAATIATAQEPAADSHPQSVHGCCGPSLPRTKDADPAVRHEMEVKAPTRLTVNHHGYRVNFGVDTTHLETVKVSVGEKMVTGLKYHVRIYPADHRPAEEQQLGLDGQIRFEDIGAFTRTLPARRSVVEIDLEIFETDMPAQHMWMPGGDKYRVIWRRTLSQVVE